MNGLAESLFMPRTRDLERGDGELDVVSSEGDEGVDRACASRISFPKFSGGHGFTFSATV